MKTDVLVIGGGIAGAATAYYLAAEGVEVTLVEAHDLNTQASGANAGSIHVQLQHPEFVTLGPDWARAYGPTLRLLIESRRMWSTLGEELGVDLDVKFAGGLLVATTEEEMRQIEAKAEIWWQALEDIIREKNSVEFDLGQGIEYRETASIASKCEVFDELYWYMRKKPEADRLRLLHALAKRYQLDLTAHCRALIMEWQELQTFIDEPLCTIGAHTMNHFELKKLSEDQMAEEISKSVELLAEKTGKPPAHFSYPVGGPLSAGKREFAEVKRQALASAVTTRPGGLYAENAEYPEALPRISLNGNYQKQRFIDVFLTGAIFTAHSGMKRVNLD